MTRTEFIASIAAIPFIGKLFKKPATEVRRGLYTFSRTSNGGPFTISMKNTCPYPSALFEVDGKRYLIQGGPDGTTTHEITNEARWKVVSDDIKMKEGEYDIFHL